jgi:hypothetical protein
MSDHGAPPGKLMVDPYLDWAQAQAVPIHDDFALDLLAVEPAPWARFDCKGAIAHVKGRGDFMTVFVIEIPPGGKISPQRHMFEGACLVLSGHGSTTVEDHFGARHSFEWGTNSIFAPPLNSRYQIFNASGREAARIAIANNLPAVLNLFHSERFVFENPFVFPEREGPATHFEGKGDFVNVRPGKHMWETNFVPDATDLELPAWGARGAGSTNIKLILADGILHAHLSEMPVGSYKKAHRHVADVHVFCLKGEGYSLFWYEGDDDFICKEWRHGWVFAPPDMMYHQHFNAGGKPVRYLAVGHGSIRYPFTQNVRNIIKSVDLDVKDGGNQIEYAEQDPRIHQIFARELAKRGLAPKFEFTKRENA